LKKLAERAKSQAAYNILFDCLWLTGDVPGAVELLRTVTPSRKAEAALFALTYAPSQAPACVKAWKEALEADGKGRVSRAIGVPPGTEDLEADDELFEQWETWLEREKTGGTAVDADEGGVTEEEARAEEELEPPVEEGEEEVDEEDAEEGDE
jgi:coatomer subunit beta'